MSALAKLQQENKQLKILLKKAIALLKQSKTLLKPAAPRGKSRKRPQGKAAKR